jgi:hypothetical protein
MIKVYFESNSHAELVAIFNDEATYLYCVDKLEKMAKSYGMIVTETIDEENDIINLN